jgi:hypothetical protein
MDLTLNSMKPLHWVLVGIGAWLALSPWFLGFSTFNIVKWNNVLLGALLIIFTFWIAGERPRGGA